MIMVVTNMTFERRWKHDINFREILIFTHSKFSDQRGNLWSSFDSDLNQMLLDKTGINFGHDKFALNCKNVLRGIHGDNKSWKLVTAVYGKFFQVVVDCRLDSVSYLKYTTLDLDYKNPVSVLIPPGFGNSFLSMTDQSVYHYKLAYDGEYNDASNQFTYRWNDPRIGISWPNNNPILSKRDAQ